MNGNTKITAKIFRGFVMNNSLPLCGYDNTGKLRRIPNQPDNITMIDDLNSVDMNNIDIQWYVNKAWDIIKTFTRPAKINTKVGVKFDNWKHTYPHWSNNETDWNFKPYNDCNSDTKRILPVNDIVCIDLDDVTDDKEVQKLINLLNSYTEVSKSGNGYHIIAIINNDIKKYLAERKWQFAIPKVCGVEIFTDVFRHTCNITESVYEGRDIIRALTMSKIEKLMVNSQKRVQHVQQRHTTHNKYIELLILQKTIDWVIAKINSGAHRYTTFCTAIWFAKENNLQAKQINHLIDKLVLMPLKNGEDYRNNKNYTKIMAKKVEE
jgi:hypothetical protein